MRVSTKPGFKALIIHDVHAPYHCERSLQAIERWARPRNFDAVVLNGDGADMYAASKFKKDPKRKYLVLDECMEAQPVLARIRKLGKAGYYLMGNHEVRYENLIRDSAPMLEGIRSLGSLLDLDDWVALPYKKQMRLGKLRITHDLGFCGINAVRQALSQMQHSVVTGHTHYMQMEYTGNMEKERRVGASFGHLCDEEKVDYAYEHQIPKWQKGCGHVEFYEKDLFHLYAHPIVEGRLL